MAYLYRVPESCSKMKIQYNQDKQPLAARIINVLISIHIIFVTRAQNGELVFRLHSFKCFIGTALWLLIPVGGTNIAFYIFTGKLYGDNLNVKEHANIKFIVTCLNYACLLLRPFLISFLVSHTNFIPSQQLKIPERWYLVLTSLLCYAFMIAFFFQTPGAGTFEL